MSDNRVHREAIRQLITASRELLRVIVAVRGQVDWEASGVELANHFADAEGAVRQLATLAESQRATWPITVDDLLRSVLVRVAGYEIPQGHACEPELAADRCPVCRKHGSWRRGVGFEHEMRCGRHEAGVVWCPDDIEIARNLITSRRG